MLILGFFLLILGANLLVKGSSNIAKRFYIPETLIGLTIVAIGTSMPELIITITSASSNATDLIIGNAIGSNLCNLLFILGVISTIKNIEIDKDTRFVHLPVALVSTLAILGMGIGLLGSPKNIISRNDGIILATLYLIYFMYPIIVEIEDIIKSIKENKKEKGKTKSNIILSILYIILGIIGLKYGGDWVVEEATEIATIYGISERVIGLTIVAIGTALPEFITSVIAVLRNEADLATGNLVGSCILNSFLILGAGAIMTPLAFSTEFINNTILLASSIVLIWIFANTGKKNTVTRFNGIVLLSVFAWYMVNLFK